MKEIMHTYLMRETDIRVGDTVKITHSVPSEHMGWKASWVEGMDKFVGRVGTVMDSTGDYGFRVSVPDFGDYDNYNFPVFCLEKVEVKRDPKTECTNKNSLKIRIMPDNTAVINDIVVLTKHEIEQLYKATH